jgi:4-hydroxy-3-methylbut-2-enyl diphosphate reductase IspH
LGARFTRIQLEDFAPTKHELAVTAGAAMPEQVVIGHIRAVHRANGGRRDDDLTLNFPSFWGGTL